MSTNSLTMQHIYDRRATQSRDYMSRYIDALKKANRLVLDAETEADDQAANDAYEDARKLAHVAADHGEKGPLIDQLERAYADD